MAIVWWEKTVEYFFVREYIDLDVLVAPLDGDHEKVGDTVIADADKWVIIEFKRDAACIAAEQKKFTDFLQAKFALGANDKHHLLVYGDANADDAFFLKCQTYFSGRTADVASITQCGVDQAFFTTYLRRFVEFKKEKKGSSTGGLEYGYVAGISSSSNRITKCLTLSEYAREYKLEKEINLSIGLSIGRGPSFDR